MKDIFKNDDTYLARWLNDELSPEEKEAFEASEDFAAYKRIADKTAALEGPAWDKKRVWDSIQKGGDVGASHSSTLNKSFLFHGWAYAAAAVLVLVIGYWTLLGRDGMKTYEAMAGETRKIELQDGSLVHLNAASILRVDQNGYAEERKMILEGEAFFEVQKGKTFTVKTGNGDVRVLGTSFNIRSRNDRIEVNCYTGRVSVSFDEFTNSHELIAGDLLVGQNLKMTKKTTFNTDGGSPDWRNGRTRFVDSPMEEVINELERQFDIEIVGAVEVRQIQGYNGGFDHSDLKTALDIVFSTIPYEYSISGRTVTLTKKD